MSTGPKPTFLKPVYDAQELRRRMAVGFTIGELCRLAERLQVPQLPSWTNSPQDAARDIVRHFERSGAVAVLVEELHREKPLVAWPDPLPPKETPPAPAAVVAPTVIDVETKPGDRPTPIAAISAADVQASLRASGPPEAPSGFAPAMMPRPGEAPPAPKADPADESALAAFESAGTGTAAKPARAEPPSSAPIIKAPQWPATAPSDKPQKTRAQIDVRVLGAAVFGLLFAAVLIAFFVGRASSSSSGEEASTTSSSSEPQKELPKDQVAIVDHVTLALGASLERVAQECEIDPTTLRGRPLFQVAYHRCGAPPAQPVFQRPASPNPQPILVAPQGDPPEPPPQQQNTRPSGNKLQKVDTGPAPVSGASSCLTGCSRDHKACTSRCGAEPKQGSQYDAYQSCLSGCLKALSRCKLACQ